MKIDETKIMAARKRAAPTLRRVTDNDPQGFEGNTLSWSEINKRQAEILNTARGLLDKAENATEAEARDLDAAHTCFMEIWDHLEQEKDWRTESGSREPRSQAGNPRRPNMEDRCEIRDGGFDGNFDGHSADLRTAALKPEQRFADRVMDMRQGRSAGAEFSQLSEGAYLRSLVLGGRSDLERRALSEGTDSAGGFTVPEIVSARLIDRMRARTVVIAAGAQTIPLTSDTAHYARVATDPVPAWRAEAGAVAESGPTFDRVTFSPRSLAVLVKVSRELLEDSLNIDQALPNVIAQAMALEVDRVALFGSGTAPEPRGIVNTTGVTAQALGAQLTSYAPLVTARTTILTNNAPGLSAFVMHPREEGNLAGLVDGQGNPLNVPPKIAEVPFRMTSAVPINGGTGTNESSIIGGYFPHLVLGMRTELRIEILRERFADNLQYGFLAHLRVDVALEQPSSFVKITGIRP